MGPTVTKLTVTLSLLAIAAWAEAQTPAQTHQAPPAAGQPHMPGSQAGPSMMGQHGHMHGGGPGMMGGMREGMRCQMMGGMLGPLPPPSDPKAYGRALALRGEILKAIGEVMMKHGALEQQR